MIKMKTGIDISKWQGSVNWTKLSEQKKAGLLNFVLLRAGYGGGTIDPFFEANYAACIREGIPCGAYWYAYWGKYTPTQEATSFLKAVEGKKLQYGIWYDVEYEPDIIKLSKTERTTKTLEGLDILASSGRYVGLYASTDMVNNRMEYDRLKNYDLWVAQYGPVNKCKLPYGIWQYTSQGVITGISGRVDCNRAYKDYPTFVTGALANGKMSAVEESNSEDVPHTTTVEMYHSVSIGDIRKFLDVAESLQVDLIGDLQIGPYTKGDRQSFNRLADDLYVKHTEA